MSELGKGYSPASLEAYSLSRIRWVGWEGGCLVAKQSTEKYKIPFS